MRSISRWSERQWNAAAARADRHGRSAAGSSGSVPSAAADTSRANRAAPPAPARPPPAPARARRGLASLREQPSSSGFSVDGFERRRAPAIAASRTAPADAADRGRPPSADRDGGAALRVAGTLRGGHRRDARRRRHDRPTRSARHRARGVADRLERPQRRCAGERRARADSTRAISRRRLGRRARSAARSPLRGSTTLSDGESAISASICRPAEGLMTTRIGRIRNTKSDVDCRDICKYAGPRKLPAVRFQRSRLLQFHGPPSRRGG